jgi:hypothetical protein
LLDAGCMNGKKRLAAFRLGEIEACSAFFHARWDIFGRIRKRFLRLKEATQIESQGDNKDHDSAAGKDFSQPLGIKGHASMVNDKERGSSG